MDQTSWPRKVLKWVPQDMHKWRDNMKEAMEARDLTEEDCCRREEWGLGVDKQ
jgi:hypothetical protein